MSDQESAAADAPPRGRLAQVIASRAAWPQPRPVRDRAREALIYMLCEAAELEHGIMCQYLYAAFSLKQSQDEGSAPRKHRPSTAGASRSRTWPPRRCCTCPWCRTCCPRSARPRTCPGRTSRSPPPLPGRRAPGAYPVRRGGAASLHVPRAPGGHGHRGRRRDDRVPPRRAGHAARRDRPARVRTSPPSGTSTGRSRPESLTWRISTGAVAVRRPAAGAGDAGLLRLARTGRGDRRGLGPAGHRRDPGTGRGPAATGRARTSASSWRSWTSTSSSARPIRPSTRSGPWSLSTSGQPSATPTSAGRRPGDPAVMDAFNVAYEILLLMLQRFFAHTEETDPQLKALADAIIALMYQAIKPLGDLVTTLPAARSTPGPHGRTQLRAVLRVRLRAAAPRSGLDPAPPSASARPPSSANPAPPAIRG